MHTLKESRHILKAHGITVFNCYALRYSLRREHPGYGTAESRSPIAEWFSVSDCALGDVRAMAEAYEALSWAESPAYARICSIAYRAAWATYTAHRIDAERLGRAVNSWALPDDPDEAVAQIHARGSERARWHIHRVWRENAQRRLSACAKPASVTTDLTESLIHAHTG